MCDEKLRTDGDGAFQLAPKSLDRLRPHAFVRRSEVDEVVVVDHQGREVVPFASALKEFDAGLTQCGTFPLTRAGGEYLERIRAEFGGFQGRPFQRTGNGGMNPNSHNPS